MELNVVIANIAALFLGWFFFLAGFHKLSPANRQYYQQLLSGYGLPGISVLAMGAVGLGLLEMTVGIAVAIPAFRPIGLPLVVGLLIFYTGLVGWQMIKGNAGMDCGCVGPAGKMKIGTGLFARNLALLALSGLPIVTWVEGSAALWVLSLVGASFLALINACVEQLIGNQIDLKALKR